MSSYNCPLKTAAKDAPHLPALISKNATLTFKELDDLADSYTAKLHLQAGDILAVLHPPCIELIALFFAVWRQNASICPLNTKLPAIEPFLSRIQPKQFITSFPFSSHTNPSSRCIPQSLLLSTSGSTGTPKIAILSLQSLLTNAAYSVPLNSSDRWLLSLPLYHVGGIGIVLRCILARAAMVFDKTHPEITHLSLVPTQLYRESPVYKNLKCILLGGAPIPFIPKNLPISTTYGLTEMGSMVCLHGHPLPKREMRIASDGEIWVRGETLFNGYLDLPHHGWFATGDLGKHHRIEGLSIIGRKDWQFICGGENIQPEEIEQHLLQIPDVLEAIVLPKEDPEFGMRPVAVVRTSNPHFTLAEMQHILSDFLPKYKIPIALHLLDEFPKSGLKINRNALKNIFK